MTTVTEDIATGTDDAEESSGGSFLGAGTLLNPGWSNYFARAAYVGMRYQTVNVPNAATIDSSKVTVDIDSLTGTPDLQWYGEDADDVPTWSTSDRPTPGNVVETTASTQWTGMPSTGTDEIDVTAIIAEITVRGGWAANNDLRFLVDENTGGTANAIARFGASEHATLAGPQLEIIFTVSGVGPHNPLGHPLFGPFRGPIS